MWNEADRIGYAVNNISRPLYMWSSFTDVKIACKTPGAGLRLHTLRTWLGIRVPSTDTETSLHDKHIPCGLKLFYNMVYAEHLLSVWESGILVHAGKAHLWDSLQQGPHVCLAGTTLHVLRCCIAGRMKQVLCDFKGRTVKVVPGPLGLPASDLSCCWVCSVSCAIVTPSCKDLYVLWVLSTHQQTWNVTWGPNTHIHTPFTYLKRMPKLKYDCNHEEKRNDGKYNATCPSCSPLHHWTLWGAKGGQGNKSMKKTSRMSRDTDEGVW